MISILLAIALHSSNPSGIVSFSCDEFDNKEHDECLYVKTSKVTRERIIINTSYSNPESYLPAVGIASVIGTSVAGIGIASMTYPYIAPEKFNPNSLVISGIVGGAIATLGIGVTIGSVGYLLNSENYKGEP